ncbi:MAG: hypothetical protein JWQ85_3486, partial [Mucilaginibacter sp.]|nr:hypothetical protein [Mucilaginibacter sp.]
MCIFAHLKSAYLIMAKSKIAYFCQSCGYESA